MKRKLLLGVLLLLAACSLPQSGAGNRPGGVSEEEIAMTAMPPIPTATVETSVPTQSATESASPEPSVELAPPPPGTHMRWIDGSVVVYVPAGEFEMGADRFDDNPKRTVRLSAYWIYKTEVTNAQYARCVADGVCGPPVGASYWAEYESPYRAEHPVVGVTWEQARTYCAWAHGLLPTEAQWEKAARGPGGRTFPWGNGPANCDLLNFDDCAYTTTPVSAYDLGKSYYEAYDMAGNVQEWVRDWYDADYFTVAPDVNPPGPKQGEERSIRGSAFGFEQDVLESARRYHAKPDTISKSLGFRCVITDDAPEEFVVSPPVCVGSPRTFEFFDYSECEPPYLTPQYNGCDNGDAFWSLKLEGNLNTLYDPVNSPTVSCTFLEPSNVFYCRTAPGTQASLRFCAQCGPSFGMPFSSEPTQSTPCPPANCMWPVEEQDPETCQCVFVTNPDQGTSQPPAGDSGDGPDLGDLLEQLAEGGSQDGSTNVVSCPAGFYWDEPSQACVPYLHGFDFGIDEIKNWLPQVQVECPAGTRWQIEKNCCMPDPEFSWPCNGGYMSPNGVCQGYQDICVDAPLIFPSCATPTSPPPPAQKSCKNPSQYTTPLDCTTNNCKWVSYVTKAGGYCTYP